MNQISTKYFSKDLIGYEIETKIELLTQDPFGYILLTNNLLLENNLCIKRQMQLGNQNAAINLWKNEISFWGYRDKNDPYQVLMCAKGNNFIIPIIKISNSHSTVIDEVLIRKEDKQISKKMNTKEFQILRGKLTEMIGKPIIELGSMTRTKVFFYITYKKTNRNYCLSADLCVADNKRNLSQIEIEYKGRAGINIPEGLNPIVKELIEIRQILFDFNPNILAPTVKTKLKWIAE